MRLYMINFLLLAAETIVTNYFQFLSIGGQNEMSATKPCLYTEQRIPIELDLTGSIISILQNSIILSKS